MINSPEFLNGKKIHVTATDLIAAGFVLTVCAESKTWHRGRYFLSSLCPAEDGLTVFIQHDSWPMDHNYLFGKRLDYMEFLRGAGVFDLPYAVES